jgi:hypothetical protein
MDPWQFDDFMGSAFRRWTHRIVTPEMRRIVMLAGRGATERMRLQKEEASMGTRVTQTVGAATALWHISKALVARKLSNEALGDILEIVSDAKTPGAFNFRVVDGMGADDDAWWPRDHE